MFKHNDKVTCTIDGTKITDARISINEDGYPYICQNERKGGQADNLLDYKYSWALNRDFTDSVVTDLKLAEKTWDNLQYGDQITDSDGDIRTILVAHPNSVYTVSNTSVTSVQSISAFTYTAQSLQDLGFTIVQEEVEEITEMTLEEVAKLKGVHVSKLRIKE